MVKPPMNRGPDPDDKGFVKLGDRELQTVEALNTGSPDLLASLRRHCHDAAEDYLKAYLVRREKRLRRQNRQHDLKQLFDAVLLFEPAFRELQEAIDSLARDYPPNVPGEAGCETSVEAHYNPDLILSPAEADDWIAAARSIGEFVKARLELE